MGSGDGPLAIDGYGSSLYDMRPVGDPDTYSYKVSWTPGYGLYMYFGAFLFAIIGFFFYSKMRRTKGYTLEMKHGGEDEMVEIEFGQAQREDLAVTFYQATSLGAVYELHALEGVNYVEPFRNVPVRLVSGPRSYRTSISGYRPDAGLSRDPAPDCSEDQPCEQQPRDFSNHVTLRGFFASILATF